jgi:hypothetical protein
MAAFSFGHHGIADGDDLYVVRPAPRPRAAPDRPLRRGRGLLRGGNALLIEASRLSDHAGAAAEMRAGHRGFAAPPVPPRAPRPRPTALGRTRDPGGPSTDPLPAPWR